MTHAYYTEFNATLEAHGFEKLAEETIDALSKEAAYYDAFISTCLQQGMTKSAAATLYKEGGVSWTVAKELLTAAPKAIKNLTINMGKVRASGAGAWTAIRHPILTDRAIKGSDAAIEAAVRNGGGAALAKTYLTKGVKPLKGANLTSKEKLLNDIVKTRRNAIAAGAGSKAYKNQELLDRMMSTRVNATPSMQDYLKSLGLPTKAPRVARARNVKNVASPASPASPASTASTASAAPKATAGSTAAEGAASKATGATPQGTTELKEIAANSTATDTTALGATGTKDTAAITAGIKNKLKAWGPYALAGGAGYFLGNNGSGSAPITVAPTIMVPGAGAQGGAYIPGATQNGLMYEYG